MKVCGNCLHWTRCTDGNNQGVCYYPLPYWLYHISCQYVSEDNELAKDCECYNDRFFEYTACDECDGSGTYYIDKQPVKCICSENQD